MKANELRLNNFVERLVKNPQKGDPLYYYKISKIDQQDFYYYDENIFRPILLSENWLLKFGFESKEKGYNYLTIGKSELYIYINNNGEAGICIEDLNEDLTEEQELYFSIKIKSVHQLQNLYFALTNEELTIKQ